MNVFDDGSFVTLINGTLELKPKIHSRFCENRKIVKKFPFGHESSVQILTNGQSIAIESSSSFSSRSTSRPLSALTFPPFITVTDRKDSENIQTVQEFGEEFGTAEKNVCYFDQQ
jgi:hypothetical protein